MFVHLNCVSLVLAVFILNGVLGSVNSSNLHRRTFTNIGCQGVYDKSKFARLDRVCVECYQLYRDPEIHSMCRNEFFPRCVDALLLDHEQPRLQEMAMTMAAK